MKLTLQETRYLVEPISVISELVNEIQLKVDKEKVEVIAIDPANAALISFKLLGSAFIEYEVEKPVTIAISLDNLKAVLKRAKANETIKLEHDEEKNKLKIQIKGESTRTFNLALIDIKEKQQRIPDLKFTAHIETPAGLFEEAINDMSVFGESVSFVIEKDKFLLNAESNLNDAKAEFNHGEETHIKNDSGDDIKSRYSLEYLRKIAKGGKLARHAQIQFSNDYPLKISYHVKDKMSIETILAPRVQTD
ncbi:MAG: proliferating cell nuclear antigen (pcna) [Nanoarchaeota archaeon]|nr:proliferating cell nuclear antigen (pcna) [Nanoarchaeota archaeon]